jgi:hypothetical protein
VDVDARLVSQQKDASVHALLARLLERRQSNVRYLWLHGHKENSKEVY